MKATINIQEDAGLKAAIKDAIKGQVMAVTREEITDIVRDEIAKKMKNSDKSYMDRLLKDSMEKVVSNILYKEHGVHTWQNDWIQPSITKYLDAKVKEALKGKDWNALVDTMAKQKIKDMMK